MSPDEKSLHIAQAHLKPGEILRWSGPAGTKPRRREALRIAAIPFLSCLLFGAVAAYGMWHMDQESARFWANHPHPGWSTPVGSLDFLFPLFFFGGFGAVLAALIVAAYQRLGQGGAYAVTDRRILFFSTANGTPGPVAVYGPEDIEFLRRQDYPDGTGDLFFRRAAPGRRTIEINGLSLPFAAQTPDVGLCGIADVVAVESLIFALRAGQPPGAAPLAVGSVPADKPAEREMIFPRPKLDRIVGAIFAGLGCAIVGTCIAVGWGTNPISLGILIFLIFGLAFALPGFGLLLWCDTLTLDCAAQTYRRQHGIFPFLKSVTGPFTDFERIRVTRKNNTGNEGPDYLTWPVHLHWKDEARKPSELLMATDAPAGRDEGRRLAAALGLPLDDRSAEPTSQEQKEQADLADPEVQARKVRKGRWNRRWWIAFGALLGLLFVNSLLQGIVYVAQWKDSNGSRVIQQSTGFWTQTQTVGIFPGNGSGWTSMDTASFLATSNTTTYWGQAHSYVAETPAGEEKKDYHGSLRLGLLP